jgi:hypothetical protein
MDSIVEKKERSRAYPSISLSDAIEKISLIKDNLGRGPYSRESIAHAIGYSSVSGTSATKIGALVHFGLLDIERGGVYQLTDLAKMIASPKDDNEYNHAIITSIRKPALYNELIERFKGSSLPKLLPNILEREYKIISRQSKYVSELFIESLTYANLLRNGIVINESIASNIANSTEEQHMDQTYASSTTNHFTQDVSENPHINRERNIEGITSDNHRKIQIPLSKDRNAFLIVPEPMDEKDFSKIIAWLNFHAEIFEMEKPEIR